MKIQSIFYWISLIIISASCKSYEGEYNFKSSDDLFWTYRLTLKKYKTFLYQCIGHNCGNHWSYGYWSKKKDTIYFTRKILYDTLRFPKDNFDTLMLSDYPIPKLKVYDSILAKDRISYLSLYGKLSLFNPQNTFFIFHKEKLIIKKNKLYELNYENDKISEDYFIEKSIEQTLK